MKLIVGLGNPGDKYQKTRHNLGFMVVGHFVDSTQQVAWEENKKLKSLVVKINGLILAKPQTYMNESGEAVMQLANFYKIAVQDIWVIHDDLDLPFGKLRIQKGGTSAGHNGVESIIENLGAQEFIRFKVGIGRPSEKIAAEDYVLQNFDKEEEQGLKKMLEEAYRAIQVSLGEGLDKAMNKLN